MTAIIQEFKCTPEVTYQNDDKGDPKPLTTWHNVVSIDMRWIAAAQPALYPDGQATSIVLCGSGRYDHTLNVPYSLFMEMWQQAKKQT